MLTVATTFATQPVCNAAQAAHTLHSDQYFLKSLELIHLVDDILGPCWTLGVVGQSLHGQPELMTHGPAVGVPPGGVPHAQEPVVQEGGDQTGLACTKVTMRC